MYFFIFLDILVVRITSYSLVPDSVAELNGGEVLGYKEGVEGDQDSHKGERGKEVNTEDDIEYDNDYLG